MTEPVSGIIASMRHVRAGKLCANGMRGWFSYYDRAQLRTFCRVGLPVEWLEAQGDAFALQVAAIARAEAVANG